MDLTKGMMASWHLTVDTTSAARELTNTGRVYICLKQMARLAGMEPLDDPTVYSLPIYPGLVDSPVDEGGVSGSLIITTSSIHCHTWPEQYKARFVLDSCRPFDPHAISTYLTGYWCGQVLVDQSLYHPWPQRIKS
jgi:S-adenosylmethionine/arginine decarboxylase-like enzyme